jgi:hypothetical protein
MMALFKRLKVPDENVLRERLHGLGPYPHWLGKSWLQ